MWFLRLKVYGEKRTHFESQSVEYRDNLGLSIPKDPVTSTCKLLLGGGGASTVNLYLVAYVVVRNGFDMFRRHSSLDRLVHTNPKELLHIS